MTPTERNTRGRRLERAGYVYIPGGWVPAAYAQAVALVIAAYRDEAERTASAAGKRGRPRKSPS